MTTNKTPQVIGNNSIVKDVDSREKNIFVKLWKQGNEILTPLFNLFKGVNEVIPSGASEENKLVTEADLKNVTDLIPEGTTEENPLVNVESLKILEEELLSINPPAANTLRFEFSKTDYDPTVAGVGSSGTWKKLSSKFHNVWDWTPNYSDFSYAFLSAFRDSSNLVSLIAAGDTSEVTDAGNMFTECTALTNVALFDTSSVENMRSMFEGCTSLTSVPLFNTSSVTDMSYMFYECTSLTSVPLFNTSSVTDMSYMFYDCTNVEGGALALYQQASTQATPPADHTVTFRNCGKDTVTGAAELAQIPTSWGGTASA